MRYYKLSIAINILGLVLALFLGYRFREEIGQKIRNDFIHSKKVKKIPVKNLTPQFRDNYYQKAIEASRAAEFDYTKGTREDWWKWRNEQQSKFVKILGDMPEKLPTLKSDVVEVREIEGVIRERVILCGEKDVQISGYLFRPREIKGKIPGIMFFSGHGSGIRAVSGTTEDYQHNAPIALAQNDYFVFTIENRAFGERALANDSHRKYVQFLIAHGSSYPAVILFDAQLALEYLLSRPEVDAEKIGATGCSMGGVIAALLADRDERIKGAVIYGAFNTAIYSNTSNQPTCTCFTIPGIFKLEPFIVYTGIAPRKLCIAIGKQDTLVPEELVKEFFGKLKKAWDINNAGDNISLFQHPGEHEMVNEHAVQTFNQWFKSK